MEKKTVSVIVPMYNGSATILKALESVRNQTFGADRFEIIVVDDGSQDDGSEKVKIFSNENPGLHIKLIHRKNGGVSAARNTALQAASGDYIALLDSDDEWLPNKVERQIHFLEDKKMGIDFLAVKRTNHKILFPYKVKEHGLAEITFRKLMIRNEAQPSTVMFKRKVLENTGFFDGNQRYAEDINYWLKVSQRNKMFILDEELIVAGGGKRTFGVSGLSANLPEMEKGFIKNLKEMYSQQRIRYVEYLLYWLFYRSKYIGRLIRNVYLRFLGK